ncbi:hypothetical protein [Asticcacaulis sp. W401b]|uniref:hypothetical protein n=1 Tax=Asticcacaulis sp. W401b TaxID=3388666 RepID=UPI003970FC9E
MARIQSSFSSIDPDDAEDPAFWDWHLGTARAQDHFEAASDAHRLDLAEFYSLADAERRAREN